MIVERPREREDSWEREIVSFDDKFPERRLR